MLVPRNEPFGAREYGSKRQVVLTDTLVILLRDCLRDHGANIASLGDILLEPELNHELVQDTRDDNHVHVHSDGDPGESVARHGGDNEVVWQRRGIGGVLFLDLLQDREELHK